MSKNPIWMNNDGLGDVDWKHPEEYNTINSRNEIKDGKINIDKLPTIATLRSGLTKHTANEVVSIGGAFCAAVEHFFGTLCSEVLENGYGSSCIDYGNNRRLVCMPVFGPKTLLHGSLASEGKPVYYYAAKKDGKPVMHLMASKRFISAPLEDIPDQMCTRTGLCVRQSTDTGYGDEGDDGNGEGLFARYTTAFTTQRPSNLGYCYSNGCWHAGTVNSAESVAGVDIPWLCEKLAIGDIPDGCFEYFMVANQKYIATGDVGSDGNLPVLTNVSTFSIFGKCNAPYLYMDGGCFKTHQDNVLSATSAGFERDSDVRGRLIQDAINEGSYPGIYYDSQGSIVKIVTDSYSEKVRYNDLVSGNYTAYANDGTISEAEYSEYDLIRDDKYPNMSQAFDLDPYAAHEVNVSGYNPGSTGGLVPASEYVSFYLDFNFHPGNWHPDGEERKLVAQGSFHFAQQNKPTSAIFKTFDDGEVSVSIPSESGTYKSEVSGTPNDWTVTFRIDILSYMNKPDFDYGESIALRIQGRTPFEKSVARDSPDGWSCFEPFKPMKNEYCTLSAWPPKYV